MRIGGTFNGTGTDLYLCIGFVPDFVHVWNLEGTQILEAYWNKHMRASEVTEGLQVSGSSSTVSALTLGNGIQPYFGGTTLATADVGTTTYGSADAVYLKSDARDYRYTNDDSPFGVGDAAEETIDTWTLTTVGSYAGTFGATGAVTGTYIGKGSPICIDGRFYAIVGFTADGGDDDDVVLNLPAASGVISYIGGMYSTRPMIAGEVSKDGFMIGDATVNVDSAMCAFEAGTYDR